MPKNNPLGGLPSLPTTHLRLWFYSAILQLAERLLAVGGPEVMERFPFVGGYLVEVEGLLSDGAATPPQDLAGEWHSAVAAWELAQSPQIYGWPLQRLTAGGLTTTHLLALMLAGLVETDARFGTVYAALHPFPDEHRLTVGLLEELLFAAGAYLDGWTVARDLLERGLLTALQEDQPRAGWPLRVPGPVWEACNGERRERPVSSMRLYEPRYFSPLEGLEQTLPPDLVARVRRAPVLIAAGTLGGLVLRGMRGSGRLATMGAVARALPLVAGQDPQEGKMSGNGAGSDQGAVRAQRGKAVGQGLLVLERPDPATLPNHFRLLGPLAALLGAVPVIDLELGPGETIPLPPLPGYSGPVGVLLGQEGGIRGEATALCATLQLPPPNRAARRTHWAQVLGASKGKAGTNPPVGMIDQLSARFHLTGGGIQQAGQLALAYAGLDGREQVSPADVQEACRALNTRVLDALAIPMETGGTWDDLIVSEDTGRDLHDLAMRCRQREAVLEHLGPGFHHVNRGVRALFSGPSGTGKTLAARILAAELGLDLYRVDLAAVVDKYVGETERNLSRLFARAEEQDIVLLLDEGDSLFTGRTDVRSANDRYANMETNYLLQRLERYEGILLVTTNAVGRIDSAFQRRMDVHIEFAAPDAAQRYAIWQHHLPRDGHQLDEALLRLVAARCALNGGQIRNGALHATVLAVEAGRALDQSHLVEAIAREYRKLGAVSPLAAMLPPESRALPGESSLGGRDRLPGIIEGRPR